MPIRKLLIAASIAIFLLSACVPLPQYMKVENELDESDSGKDKLETRIKQAEDRINQLELELEGRHKPQLALRDRWREYCMLEGRHVTVTVMKQQLQGLCEGVADDGALLLRSADGLSRCYAGVVTGINE